MSHDLPPRLPPIGRLYVCAEEVPQLTASRAGAVPGTVWAEVAARLAFAYT